MASVFMLQMRREVPLSSRQAFDLHQHRTNENESRASDVVGENRGIEIDARKSDASDQTEIEQQRHRAYRKPLDGFIETEEVHEAREETVAEQRDDQFGGEVLQLLNKRVMHERGGEEEDGKCHARAAEDHQFWFDFVKFLFVKDTAAGVERCRKQDVAVAPGKNE